MAMLEVNDVHKAYGETPVLRGIDVTVARHEVVCLIGSSGCGKSTLLRTVNLLEPIDSGSIVFNGQNISERGIDANTVRRRMGIVFQSYNLFPHLRALDNVTLGLRRALGMSRAEAEAKAVPLLDRLGLADHLRSYPNNLSGGQQQRVAICRALVGDPELLLLDEITSALDPELVGEVLAVIRSLADEGMTMILATHEMAFAKEVADSVIFLHEGTVHEQAPPGRLFSDPQQTRTQEFLERITAAGRL